MIVGTVNVPVKVGDAKLDFKFNAICVAVDIGFNKSDVLLILDVYVKGVNKFNDVCVAADIGLSKSVVLFTLDKLTIVALVHLHFQ